MARLIDYFRSNADLFYKQAKESAGFVKLYFERLAAIDYPDTYVYTIGSTIVRWSK